MRRNMTKIKKSCRDKKRYSSREAATRRAIELNRKGVRVKPYKSAGRLPGDQGAAGPDDGERLRLGLCGCVGPSPRSDTRQQWFVPGCGPDEPVSAMPGTRKAT